MTITREGTKAGADVVTAWKLVPVKPTEAMLNAARRLEWWPDYDAGRMVPPTLAPIYRAMLDAAPTAEGIVKDDPVDWTELDRMFVGIPQGPYSADKRGDGWGVRAVDTDPTNRHHWPYRLCEGIRGQKAECDPDVFGFIAGIINAWPSIRAITARAEAAESREATEAAKAELKQVETVLRLENERLRLERHQAWGDRHAAIARAETAEAELADHLHKQEHEAFKGLMTGPDPVRVWKQQAVAFAHKLDAAEAELASIKAGPPLHERIVPAQGDAVACPAAADVLAERRRQIKTEGWSPEHDDQHQRQELSLAAACYALGTTTPYGKTLWPWHYSAWKPRNYRTNLIKAGALILAEIERLDRAANKGDA